MRYPIQPVKLPDDLKGVENGKVPAGLLRPAHGGGTLHHVAAAAWHAMVEAARQDGIELGNVGAYRSYDAQVALFKQRYTRIPNGSRTTRTWNGKRYWLRRGVAPSATPGTSNHGWGIAIDVANVGTGGRLAWLLNNAARFGFSWELQEEPWHLRHVGTASDPGDLKRGDRGDHVARLQWALVDAAYVIDGAGNGIFGPRTEAAVRAFQQDHGLTPTGIADTKTRAMLGL